jgi:hypothetical protein
VCEEFNLLDPLQGFKFLFQIYNLVSKTSIRQSQLKYNGKTLGILLSKDYLPPFTSRNSNNSKRQNDDGGSNGGQGGAKRQARGRGRGRTLNQLKTYSALAEKGYHVQLEKEIEGWTPRHPVRRLSVNEILIDIEELIR